MVDFDTLAAAFDPIIYQPNFFWNGRKSCIIPAIFNLTFFGKDFYVSS